jgi:hypothetical protein
LRVRKVVDDVWIGGDGKNWEMLNLGKTMDEMKWNKGK